VRQVEEFNVVGIVPGTDPKLKEQGGDLFGALGPPRHRREHPAEPDHIFNGAIDNATGTAACWRWPRGGAQSRRAAPRSSCGRPPRSRACWAAPAYVANPVWPLAKTAADLNLDSLNFVGRTRDIGVPGAERSSCIDTRARWRKRWA
jgi:hypothetical protein